MMKALVQCGDNNTRRNKYKKKNKRFSNLCRTMKNFDKWIFLPLPCYAEPRIFWTLDLETPAQEPKSWNQML
jgi:hypothetical protein